MEKLDLDTELREWDAREENDKAVFMEYLFQLYKPEDGTYTGLWQRYVKETVASAREVILSDITDIKENPEVYGYLKEEFPTGFFKDA